MKLDRIRDSLSNKLSIYITIGVALLLSLPALWVGFQLDDNIQRLMILNSTTQSDIVNRTIDLFTFISGDPVEYQTLMDKGILPWWTLPDMKASFWRPLTSITHLYDYLFFPDNPVIMHVHSLVWFALLLGIVAVLFRQYLGQGWLPGLAFILYAIDDAHGYPIGWLANRNSLLTAFFGCVTLVFYDRWLRHHKNHFQYLAILFYVIGLFSGEAAIATCAYLFAYELILHDGNWWKRIVNLIPFGFITIIYYVLYQYQGFGTYGTGLYIDPGREPLNYLLAIIERGPLLLAAQLGGLPASFYIFLDTRSLITLWLIDICFLALLVVVLFPLIRRNQLARFWCCGMILSLLPICATFSHERLLLFVGFGGMALIAQFLTGFFDHSSWLPHSRSWKKIATFVVVLLIFVHLIVAPIILPFAVYSPTFLQNAVDRLFVDLPAEPAILDQDFIIINAPMPYFACFLPIMRLLEKKPAPKHTRILASALDDLTIERPDEKTLIITSSDGFLNSPMDNLFRGKSYPMKLNQNIQLTGMTITVLSLTDDNRPKTIKCRFAVSLDDQSLQWFFFENMTLKPFKPPLVGETLRLSSINLFQWLIS